ncbi:AMP-binding protein [Vibrio sp. PP-XX7]
MIYDDQSLTYGELNRQANQLAHWLREQGVRPDSRVAIALPRSCGLMVAILATLKAGGAYVPLDPDTPEERLSYILQDSTPNVLISSQKILSRIGQLQMDSCTCVLILDGIDQSWRQLSTENLGRRGFVRRESGERPASDAQEQYELTNRHMAYIIYTSGSTGKPKGVMVEHYQVIRLLAATQAEYQFSHQDVWTLFHSYAFDFSVWEMWGALLLVAVSSLYRS